MYKIVNCFEKKKPCQGFKVQELMAILPKVCGPHYEQEERNFSIIDEFIYLTRFLYFRIILNPNSCSLHQNHDRCHIEKQNMLDITHLGGASDALILDVHEALEHSSTYSLS